MRQVHERIREIIEKSEVSVRRFCDDIGVSNVTVYKWMSGKIVPKGENLKRFCEYFHVTPAYVMFGDGNEPSCQSIRIAPNVISIPLLDIKACCGDGADIPANIPLIRMIDVDDAFYNKYLTGANRKSLHVVHAIGDSMEPTIFEGSPVIIDTSDRVLNRDGIFAFVFNSGLFLKRVQCLPSGFLLISDNERYKPISIGEQDTLNIVGRCYCGLNIMNF